MKSSFGDQKNTNSQFSNFYEAQITIDGKKWNTNEHYFQAQKFAGTQKEEYIRQLQTPQEAFKSGRERDSEFPLRNDWEQEKDNIMYKCCMAKYSQHENLKKLLLNTRSAKIIEVSPFDSYWGWGKNKTGKNMLGVILMQIRTQFQNEQKMEMNEKEEEEEQQQ